MSVLWQLLLWGVVIGATYGLIALGFVLIYKASGVLNLAQGELVMLGAYICWTGFALFHLPVWLSLIFTLVVAVVVGLAVERITIRPLLGQPLLSIIMMTLVLSIGLRGIAILLWGAEIHSLDLFPLKGISFAGAPLSQTALWSLLLAGLAIALFWLYFNYTRGGLAMKAVAESHQVARSTGINVKMVFSTSWVIATAVGAWGESSWRPRLV